MLGPSLHMQKNWEYPPPQESYMIYATGIRCIGSIICFPSLSDEILSHGSSSGIFLNTALMYRANAGEPLGVLGH